MRIARSFEVIALAVPLALVACEKENAREAKSVSLSLIHI